MKRLLAPGLLSALLGILACGPIPIPPCVADGTCLPTPGPTATPTPAPTPTPPQMLGQTCMQAGQPCDCIDFPPPGDATCAVCVRDAQGGIIGVERIGVVPICPPRPSPTPTPAPTPTPGPTPPPSSKCVFPQGVEDQLVLVPNPKTLASTTDQIISEHTHCPINSDCVLGQSDGQFYLSTMIGWFQAAGLCAGQHNDGHTDELSVARSCEAGVVWENYHSVNFGDPKKVVWSGGGARDGWKAPVSCQPGPQPTPIPTPRPTPTPASGCTSVPTPDANTGVIHCSVKPANPNLVWCDWTPKLNDRDFCAQWGNPQALVVCPLRPEGHPERRACDYTHGLPTWIGAAPADGDPFHATAGRSATVRVITAGGADVSVVTP